MKDHKTSTITLSDIFKKMFCHSHDMQKMTEYYSKTPIGGCGEFNSRQMLLSDTFKCLPAKNSIENK